MNTIQSWYENSTKTVYYTTMSDMDPMEGLMELDPFEYDLTSPMAGEGAVRRNEVLVNIIHEQLMRKGIRDVERVQLLERPGT